MFPILAEVLNRIRHTLELNGFISDFSYIFHLAWDDTAVEVQAATASAGDTAYFVSKRLFYRNIGGTSLPFSLGGTADALAAGVTGSFTPGEAELVLQQARALGRAADFVATTLAQFQSSGDATIWSIG